MKLFKPDWVNHDDKPIFSLDIHPDGKKFATGGQGNDSGLVVIWNLIPVLSELAESDKTIPKILCQMDNHLACVNSVRWSMNGQMLASGGDDKIVMIWRRGKGGSGVFGSSGLTKTAEGWRCVSTLRGHGGDVLDLAWSPQDRWLASCSVDNTIIIWDIHALPAMVAILKGHTGLVKGVTWDPVGKFLATQSDDRTVKIWKTSDWSCHSNITEPFDECGGTTHILRLSWSPDGQYLVSAHAMNGGGPTAQIIEREGWKCDKDFVGHRKAVTCVRFHNSILKRQTPKSNKSQQYCCLAVGSRDRTLSIWMTALQRPLVVIHELFQDSILDLSWSTHGYILLACSSDGTIACVQFTAEELGTPLTEDDKNSLYQRMYGKSANIDMNIQSGKDMIVENSDLLNLSTEKPKPPNFIATVDHENSNNLIQERLTVPETIPISQIRSNDVTAAAKAIHKQIETRTPDGKRRITPMFIPLAQDEVETTKEFSSSSRKISNIITEHVQTEETQNRSSKANLDKLEKLQLDSRLTKAYTIPPAQTMIANQTSGSSSPAPQQQQQLQQQIQISVAPKTLTLNGGKAIPLKGSAVKVGGDFRVHIMNDKLNTNFGKLCKVCCYSGGQRGGGVDQLIWELFIGSPIVNFSCCTKFVLLCCFDGTIRFLSIKTGILILPVISLPTPAVLSAFSLNNELGGILSECGIVRIWDVQKETIYISTTCCDILKVNCYPHMMSITENGVPFISLTNGYSYSYSKALESWLILNSKDPIFRYGFSGTTVPTSTNIIRNMKKYPLLSFQTNCHVFQAINANPINVASTNCTDNWQSTAKLTFIENQIELCKIINSPGEMRYWYSMLGYHLACNGTEKRIRLLLNDLLGSPMGVQTNANEHKILNVDKHVLLGIILKQLKTNSEWHRIYMEYSEQLNISNRNACDVDADGDDDYDDDVKME